MSTYTMTKYRIGAAILTVALAMMALPALARPLDDGCGKIEGKALGTEGVTIVEDDVTVTFTNWTAKDGEANEFIGFDYTADGGFVAGIHVKAGKTIDNAAGGASGTWASTNGKAVSNVVVCVSKRGGAGSE